MDPLAIGATDDETKKPRGHARARDPGREPGRGRSTPRARSRSRTRPRRPGGHSRSRSTARASPSCSQARQSIASIIDNQFRPTPSSKLLPPSSTRSRRPDTTPSSSARTARSSPCPSRTWSRSSAARTWPGWSGSGLVPPERPAERGRVHVRRRLVGRHACLAAQRGRLARREDHDRAGAGEPLGRRRRRQADPARRRLRRDDRVEPLRLRHLAADALRRVRRADALGHRRGRDDVRPRLHHERPPRHTRPRDRLHVRLASRGPPRGDPPLQRDLRLRAPGDAGRHRDLRRVRAHRPPLLPHRLGLHVGRPRPQGRRHDHLLLDPRPASRPRSATSPASR